MHVTLYQYLHLVFVGFIRILSSTIFTSIHPRIFHLGRIQCACAVLVWRVKWPQWDWWGPGWEIPSSVPCIGNLVRSNKLAKDLSSKTLGSVTGKNCTLICMPWSLGIDKRFSPPITFVLSVAAYRIASWLDSLQFFFKDLPKLVKKHPDMAQFIYIQVSNMYIYIYIHMYFHTYI